jgi:general secretion pathway protein F
VPAYRYRAVDAAGGKHSGLLQADTRRLAREALRARGLIVLAIDAVAGGTPAGRAKRIPGARLGLMLGQLGSILRAGVPLEKALEAAGAAGAKAAEKELLAALRADVLAGFPLSEAMARQVRVFDPFSVAVVRAGERSGLLDEVISRLARHLEQRQAIALKIQLALIYPVVLVAVSCLTIIGLLHFVVPQIAGVFAHSKQALPLLTRALLAASNALKSGGLPLLFFTALIGAAGVLIWRRVPALRDRWQSLLLRLPVLGNIRLEADVARAVSTLALLTGSGVPLSTALLACQDVARVPRTRQGLADVRTAVEQGTSLKRAMEEAGVFPPLLVLLAGSGEESGRLPAMLEEAADRLFDSVDVRVNTLVRLFEPAVVLLMGLAVLLIVLAVLLPIFEMNQLVK